MVIDTSVSMKGNFQIVKDNLALLFQVKQQKLFVSMLLIECMLRIYVNKLYMLYQGVLLWTWHVYMFVN